MSHGAQVGTDERFLRLNKGIVTSERAEYRLVGPVVSLCRRSSRVEAVARRSTFCCRSSATLTHPGLGCGGWGQPENTGGLRGDGNDEEGASSEHRRQRHPNEATFIAGLFQVAA
jgi:hypothetical protein